MDYLKTEERGREEKRKRGRKRGREKRLKEEGEITY